MKSATGRLVFTALTLIVLAGFPALAFADVTSSGLGGGPSTGIVSFIFGGTVNSSSLDGVSAGAHFSGTFTYDATLSNGGNPGSFDFSQLPIAHTLSVGAGTFADQSISSILPTSPLDQYTIQTTTSAPGAPSTFVLTTSTVQNPQPDAVTLTLTDAKGKSFSLDSLPTTLNLANFSAATLAYDPPAGTFSGDITSLQQLSQAVPEPDSVVLLGLGLAAVFAYRKRLAIGFNR